MVVGCDNLELSGPSVFDIHLISFDYALHLILNPELRDHVDDGDFCRHFKTVEGIH